MSMSTQLSAALEDINFQRDALLFKEMTLQISLLFNASAAEQGDILKRLSAIAFDKTGMTFNFWLLAEDDPNAFIITADSNSANPMRPDVIKEQLRRTSIPSEKDLFKGTVDLRTGRVSGIYSEVPLDIFFSMAFFKKTPKGSYFQPEEIAAILLHEMGHGLMYLRYLGGLTLANIVVGEIISKYQEGADPVIMAEVIKVAEQKTGYRLKDLGPVIGAGKSPLLIQQVIMSAAIEQIRSELGTRYYDARAFEFTADQFAARHGAGEYIVTGLDRMYREFGYAIGNYQPRWFNMASGLISIIHNALLCTPLFGVGSIALTGKFALGLSALLGGGITAIILAAAFGTVMSLLCGGDIYDDIPNRYKAVRRELIASSKDRNLNATQRQAIVDSIDTIDQVLKGVHDAKWGPGFITNFVEGMLTGKTAQMKFMRQLEEMANNRLFELNNQLQAKA